MKRMGLDTANQAQPGPSRERRVSLAGRIRAEGSLASRTGLSLHNKSPAISRLAFLLAYAHPLHQVFELFLFA